MLPWSRSIQKIAARHTVTFKADGKVLKTMTVRNGYILKDSDYPSIPVKKGYTGSWPKTVSVIRADTVISAIYKSTGGGGITVPTRPSGEIMSVDEVEPIEEEAADEMLSRRRLRIWPRRRRSRTNT